MAHDVRLSNEAVNVAVNQIASLLAHGFLRIYDGVRPATADDAITTQVLLAELGFSAPAFLTAVAGVAQSLSIIAEESAPASGTATWFRTVKSDGTSVVFDGSVGLINADLLLDSVDIAQFANVSIASMTCTLPKG